MADFARKTAIVTGAGQGIGRSIAHALSEEGMQVVVSDLDDRSAKRVAADVGGLGVRCDVRDPSQLATLVDEAKCAYGEIDLICSNAGFAKGEPDGPTSQNDAHWQASWDTHVMAHVRLCRLVLPEMLARGSGTLVNVASAAGLLSQIGDAAYSATKHAAVSVAQSLAIEHGDTGIDVSVLCPEYVATQLLGYDAADSVPKSVLTPDEVAQSLISGLKNKRFLILPHDRTDILVKQKGSDTDRWIKGMRRLRREVKSKTQEKGLAAIHKYF